MFELTDQTATIRSVTPRAERHGEDSVPAVSIGLSITAANTILDKLSPTLRSTLYTAPESQNQLPGIDEHLPLLRCVEIGTLTLDCKALEGWTLHIDWGIDEQGSINCGGCRIDKWKLTPMQGGSVELGLRIGTSDVDADSMGRLGMLLGQDVDITLTAPVVQEPAIDASKDGDWPFPTNGGKPATGPDATDLFAGRHVDAEGRVTFERHDSDIPHGDPEEGDDTDGEGSDTDIDPDGPLDLEDRLEVAIEKPRRRGRAAASVE